MLRITRRRQFRISNRMAVMAALLLIVTAAAGIANPIDAPDGATPTMAETSRTLPAAEASTRRVSATAGQKKRFKVNLYLFRRN